MIEKTIIVSLTEYDWAAIEATARRENKTEKQVIEGALSSFAEAREIAIAIGKRRYPLAPWSTTPTAESVLAEQKATKKEGDM